MKVSIFRNIFDLDAPFHTDVFSVLERIKQCKSVDIIRAVRSEKDKSARNELKKKLPSIIFSGEFSNRRSDSSIVTHSGLICLDIDGLDYDIKDVKAKICSDRHTFACFVSPSGDGLKVLVRIPADIHKHKNYYLGLEKYYIENLGIVTDPACKNIGRVCYESIDADLFLNKDSEVFKNDVFDVKESKTSHKSEIKIAISERDTVERLLKWWQQNYSYTDGSKHNSIIALSTAFVRFGVSKTTALLVCNSYATSEKSQKLNADRIEWAYRKYAHTFGSEFFEDKHKIDTIVNSISSNDYDRLSEIKELADYTTEQVQAFVKQKQEKPVTGRVFWSYEDGKTKINIKRYIEFIESLGYRLYYENDKPDCYILIKIIDNKVHRADTRAIKEDVLAFVDTHRADSVYNMLNDKAKFFQMSMLNALKVEKPKFLEDTADTCHLLCSNGVYSVTKNRAELIDYIDLNGGYVWSTQVSDKAFEYKGESKGDFFEFLRCICGNKEDKFLTMQSTIGYLVHTYKDPANAKIVNIFDKNLSQMDGKPEGGSGKSLIFEGLKHLREVAEVSGDRVDFTRSFLFQEVSESTQIIWIDELDKNTDMSKYFSRITGSMTIERKNKQPITLQNSQFGKFATTSNYKFKGVSGSHRRRRVEIGVEPYFSADFTPLDKFKRRFFLDWDKTEWDNFFTTIVNCVRLFLDKGIVPHIDEDIKEMEIIAATDKNFAYFFLSNDNLNRLISYKTANGRSLYRQYIDEIYEGEEEISIKKFYILLKELLSLYNVKYRFEGKGDTKQIIFYEN